MWHSVTLCLEVMGSEPGLAPRGQDRSGVCQSPEGFPAFASCGQLQMGLVEEETQTGAIQRQRWPVLGHRRLPAHFP